MINLPTGRQTFDYDCGAKALQLVMAYYGVEIREDELMSQLGSSPDGTSIESMIQVAERHGFQVEAACNTTIAKIKEYLDENYPVIILLQAWADRFMTLEDWKEDTLDGHYVIVISYVNGIIVFEDPSSFHLTWLSETELNARWHDIDPDTQKKLDRFAMVLKGKDPVTRKLEHMN
jgi:ABC-type bacteriocin/lantibiotic exporter with double-glycine peptidase domain